MACVRQRNAPKRSSWAVLAPLCTRQTYAIESVNMSLRKFTKTRTSNLTAIYTMFGTPSTGSPVSVIHAGMPNGYLQPRMHWMPKPIGISATIPSISSPPPAM